jgi:hypothetical protein
MASTFPRLPHVPTLLLLLFVSISCSGFQHGFTTADYEGHWWPVVADDPREPSGFKRLELETAFDPTLTEFVAAHGRPDFIHVIDVNHVELLYFQENAIYHFARPTLDSESSIQHKTSIADARGDLTGFVPRPAGPAVPSPAAVSSTAAVTGPSS